MTTYIDPEKQIFLIISCLIVYYLRGVGQIYCLIKTNCDCLTKYLMKFYVVYVFYHTGFAMSLSFKIEDFFTYSNQSQSVTWDTLCYSFLNQDINQ